ncbi:MAG: PLP-dependent aminotransferase family protein [Afipia sp.]|nr:PLP-dependent aminotransferase family protein [Afipia sp.]
MDFSTSRQASSRRADAAGTDFNDSLFWGSLFPDLNRRGSFLQLQIRQAIITAIEKGRLPLGLRMPSSRDLATTLRVSRNTVVIAYEQLVDQNFLISRERRGYFVAGLPKKIGSGHLEANSTAEAEDGEWDERFALKTSRFHNITKPLDWQNYPYPFIFGQFDPSLFPTNDWRESARAALSMAEINNWARDMIDGDDPALIEQLQLHVLPRRGIRARPDEIMMSMGAQHALYLIARLFIGLQTIVGMEDPGYPDARNIFNMMTSAVLPLPIDPLGLVPGMDFAKCNLAYVTASQQCPTAVVMPLSRRHEVLEKARLNKVLLIEDDYGSELIPEEGRLPPLVTLDSSQNVLYVGSLSKALAPGLRLGYVVAPSPVIRELRALRRLMLRHPPLNNQRVAALFIGLGHYKSHLGRVAYVLSERARILDRLIPEYFPGCKWSRGAGSTNYWISCPEGQDATLLTQQALAEGVVIEPGDVFSSEPGATRHCFRLGFSSIRTDRIEEGLQRLGGIIRRG